MGEQRGLAPLLTVDLAPVTVELNLRESGARFPCKWSSVLEIYTYIQELRGAAKKYPHRWYRSNSRCILLMGQVIGVAFWLVRIIDVLGNDHVLHG